MRHPLPKQLPDFSQANILIVGDVMLDRYWFGDTGRISPEAPVPVVNICNIDNRPGGAGNVALNIAALGANAILLGIVGNDEAGDTLAKQLDGANVTHDFCTLPDASTIIKLRVISRQQQLIRLDFEKSLQHVPHDALLSRFKKHLSKSNLVILSDYSKGALTDPQAFIKLAHEANVTVLVDPKSHCFRRYMHADIITPNFKEFEAVVGTCRSEREIQEKGQKLLEEYHFGALLITRGEDGMTLIEKNGVSHLPAYAREVYDVTGAGDTVISMLGSAVAAGVELTHAMTLANLAASLAVSKLGAVAVSAPELEVALTGKTSFNTGVLNEEQLLRAVQEVRSAGKKVVFTNGCYDVIHAGHVTSLQLAKELGDYLIVAVNTDESIRKLKGPNRPINNLDHRMTVLAGLDVVDWVIPFADDTPERLLSLLKPDILAKGSDYTVDQVVGANIVRSYGGEVRIVQHQIKTSSTSIINQLQTPAWQGEG